MLWLVRSCNKCAPPLAASALLLLCCCSAANPNPRRVCVPRDVLQGGLLGDLTGDITLSVPSLAELAGDSTESTAELGEAMQGSTVELDAHDQGITASLPRLSQLVSQHAAEQEQEEEEAFPASELEATMELTGTVSHLPTRAGAWALHPDSRTIDAPKQTVHAISCPRSLSRVC